MILIYWIDCHRYEGGEKDITNSSNAFVLYILGLHIAHSCSKSIGSDWKYHVDICQDEIYYIIIIISSVSYRKVQLIIELMR